MKKNKDLALELLKQKINGEIKITYAEISKKTEYTRMQLSRFSNLIEKKDIESLLVHGLTGKSSNNSAPNQEIEYIKDFKKQYPIISISQFQDIYHEDVIWNKEKQDCRFFLKVHNCCAINFGNIYNILLSNLFVIKGRY